MSKWDGRNNSNFAVHSSFSNSNYIKYYTLSDLESVINIISRKINEIYDIRNDLTTSSLTPEQRRPKEIQLKDTQKILDFIHFLSLKELEKLMK